MLRHSLWLAPVIATACATSSPVPPEPNADTAGLTLELRFGPSTTAMGHVHPETLTLRLLNPSRERRAYLLSDKINPTRLEIVDPSGADVRGEDAGALPDFDSAAPVPKLQWLEPGAGVVIRERVFLVYVKESAGDYRLDWRPVFYPPFRPGRYRARAVWHSRHGFLGTLASNTVEFTLPER